MTDPNKPLRLTPAMRQALEGAAFHGSARHGLIGRSAHGGFSRTLSALRWHKLLDWQNQITPAGRQAIGDPSLSGKRKRADDSP